VIYVEPPILHFSFETTVPTAQWFAMKGANIQKRGTSSKTPHNGRLVGWLGRETFLFLFCFVLSQTLIEA
jgi:hypothetical protein